MKDEKFNNSKIHYGVSQLPTTKKHSASSVQACQNCKKDFSIESEDFNFYEKIKVPPPTFCPECRFQRRMAWRNDRTLYKRTCDLCKNVMISMYPEVVDFPVYCKECWYSDKWDATEYGQDYDFSKSFFEQWKEISKKVPRLGIWQRNIVNSPYSNMVGESKNVYLSVSVVLGSENIFYSKTVDKSFNIFDSSNIKESENCFENIEGERNYDCQNVILSRNCIGSHFLVDCVNCSNCALSSNLRNKEFYFRNKQFSKEEYLKEIKKLNLGSRNARNLILEEFENICKKAIYRYAFIVRGINSIGNNLLDVKDCKYCFDVYNTENGKYCYRVINSKDCMDMDFAGKSELMYEYNTGALNDYNIKFSYSAMDQVQNAEYIESCIASTNLFGCISIKNKKNAILNKVYSKENFEALKKEIIISMDRIPYIDKKGRIYKYGEFFPIELSSFAYNETVAQDFKTLTRENIISEGYRWRESEEKKYNISMFTENIPDNIYDTKEEILNEILECVHKEKCDHPCMKAFRLTKDEFSFYKKHNIPIPNKCSNCRYYERFSQVLPPKLWHRKCMKENCPNEFETSYAPEREEIVYCESCYNKEIY